MMKRVEKTAPPGMRSRFRTRGELLALSDAARLRYGVSFSYFGKKVVRGDPTRKAALVCVVRRKRKQQNIPREQRIPKSLSAKTTLGDCRITTDVIEVRSSFRPAGIVNPGDTVRGGGFQATLGAFGRHKSLGRVFVTAGHFADQVGSTPISLFDLATNTSQSEARIRVAEFFDGIDYALVSSQSPAGVTFTNAPLDTVYQPVAKRDIGRTVYVVARGGYIKTVCRGIDATIAPPYHTTTMRNLILTDIANRPGDSGAALIDSDHRVWGFLSGIFRGKYSVFMPAVRLLSRQNIVLGEV